MNEKFYNLSKEKQDRMINGAIKVFAMHGYLRASTDVIIKEAGISKGLLFHYFGSKKNLYEYVAEYCSRYYVMELTTGVPNTERNLFERFRLAEEMKLRMLKNYPYLELFLIRMAGESDAEIAEFAQSWTKKVEEADEKVIIACADEALLRGNLTMDKAREVVKLCMDGYKGRFYNQGVEPEKILEGFMPYLEILKINMTR